MIIFQYYKWYFNILSSFFNIRKSFPIIINHFKIFIIHFSIFMNTLDYEYWIYITNTGKWIVNIEKSFINTEKSFINIPNHWKIISNIHNTFSNIMGMSCVPEGILVRTRARVINYKDFIIAPLILFTLINFCYFSFSFHEDFYLFLKFESKISSDCWKDSASNTAGFSYAHWVVLLTRNSHILFSSETKLWKYFEKYVTFSSYQQSDNVSFILTLKHYSFYIYTH